MDPKGLVELAWSFFKAGNIPLLALALYGLLVVIDRAETNGDTNYQDRLDRLNAARGRTWYRASLNWGLQGLSRVIGDGRAGAFPPVNGGDAPPAPQTDNKPSLTARGYLFCVLLATLYPFLFVYVNWLASDRIGALGDMPIFPDAPASQRLLSIFLLAGSFLCGRQSGRAVESAQWLRGTLWFIGLIAFGSAFAVAVAVAGASTAAIAIAFAVAFAFAGAGAVAGTGAVAIAGNVAFAGAIAFTTAAATADLVAGIIAIAIAFVVTFAGALTFYRLGRVADRRRQGLPIGAVLALVLVVVAAAIYSLGEAFGAFPDADDRHDFQQVAALLVVIPLVNAFMDWLSLGASRHFFNKSLETTKTGRALIKAELGYWLADLLVGLLCLAGAACLTTMAFAYMDAVAIHASGAPAIEARALLLAMQAKPFAAEHLWVHLLVLTTLFWTALHFIMVMSNIVARFIFAYFPMIPDRLAKMYTQRIERAAKGKPIGSDDTKWMILMRAGLHWAGWILPLLMLYLIGLALAPVLDDMVSMLITHALLPLHDWTSAVVTSML